MNNDNRLKLWISLALAAVTLTVLVRAGRSIDYKHKMLRGLWAILQRATGAADAQMLVAIEEAPASNAMEMGQIMPAVTK